MNYWRRHFGRVVDLSEVGLKEIYEVDILSAIRLLEDVWNGVTKENIFKCWRTAGDLAQGP